MVLNWWLNGLTDKLEDMCIHYIILDNKSRNFILFDRDIYFWAKLLFLCLRRSIKIWHHMILLTFCELFKQILMYCKFSSLEQTATKCESNDHNCDWKCCLRNVDSFVAVRECGVRITMYPIVDHHHRTRPAPGVYMVTVCGDTRMKIRH